MRQAFRRCIYLKAHSTSLFETDIGIAGCRTSQYKILRAKFARRGTTHSGRREFEIREFDASLGRDIYLFCLTSGFKIRLCATAANFDSVSPPRKGALEEMKTNSRPCAKSPRRAITVDTPQSIRPNGEPPGLQHPSRRHTAGAKQSHQ